MAVLQISGKFFVCCQFSNMDSLKGGLKNIFQTFMYLLKDGIQKCFKICSGAKSELVTKIRVNLPQS